MSQNAKQKVKKQKHLQQRLLENPLKLSRFGLQINCEAASTAESLGGKRASKL